MEKEHENFVAAVTKWEILAAVKKKVNKNTYDIFSKKRLTKKFLEVSNCSHAKQRQRNIQKNCTALGRVVHSWVNITQG